MTIEIKHIKPLKASDYMMIEDIYNIIRGKLLRGEPVGKMLPFMKIWKKRHAEVFNYIGDAAVKSGFKTDSEDDEFYPYVIMMIQALSDAIDLSDKLDATFDEVVKGIKDIRNRKDD